MRLSSLSLLSCLSLLTLQCGGQTSADRNRPDAGGQAGSGSGASGGNNVGGSGAGGGAGDASAGFGGSAGLADAGPGDSGSIDSGSADSSQPDAGPSDAGPSDAGTDALPADAGEVEEATIVAAWEQIKQDYCGNLAHCCAAEGKTYDQAACEAMMDKRAQARLAEVDTQLAAGHRLDPERVDASVAAYAEAAQSCAGGSPLGSARYWVGDQALGTECVRPEYCAAEPGASSMECTGSPLHCTAIYYSQLGEACTTTCRSPSWSCVTPTSVDVQRHCVISEGVYCDFTTDQCAATLAEGESCWTGECDTTTYCDHGTRLCTPRLPTGGDCSSNSNICALDAWCNAGSCTPRKPDGEPCESSGECLSWECGWKGCGTGSKPDWYGYCE